MFESGGWVREVCEGQTVGHDVSPLFRWVEVRLFDKSRICFSGFYGFLQGFVGVILLD